MARIEISMEEYQGMRSKIERLESALGSVSQESARNKELIEEVKAMVEDLEEEPLYGRIFMWKKVVKSFKDVLNGKGNT